MIKICVECGNVFETAGRSLCCSRECTEKRRKRQLKQAYLKWNAKRIAEAQAKAAAKAGYVRGKAGSVCDDYCRTCGYFFDNVCNYIIINNRSRPCPAGQRCTEREERPRYRDPYYKKSRKDCLHSEGALPAGYYEEP